MIKSVNRALPTLRVEELPREFPKPGVAEPWIHPWTAQLDKWWFDCRSILKDIEAASAQEPDDTSWKQEIASLKIRATSLEAGAIELKNQLDPLTGTPGDIESIQESITFIKESIEVLRWRVSVIEGKVEDFTFEQLTPATPWTITHPLGRRVNVRLMDLSGNHMECEAQQPNTSTVIVNHNGARSGRAILS